MNSKRIPRIDLGRERELDLLVEDPPCVVSELHTVTYGVVVDEGHALAPQVAHGGGDVVHGEGDVVYPLAAPLEEIVDYALGSGRFHQLEIDLAQTAHAEPHVVAGNLDHRSGRSAEQIHQ